MLKESPIIEVPYQNGIISTTKTTANHSDQEAAYDLNYEFDS